MKLSAGCRNHSQTGLREACAARSSNEWFAASEGRCQPRYYNVPSRGRNRHDASRVARECMTHAPPFWVGSILARLAIHASASDLESVFRARVTRSIGDDALACTRHCMQMRLHVSCRQPRVQCCWRDERALHFFQNRCSKTLVSLRLTQITGRISDFFQPSRSPASSARESAPTQTQLPTSVRLCSLQKRLTKSQRRYRNLVTVFEFEIRELACNAFEFGNSLAGL